MPYRKELWTGKDPLYAPGMNWTRDVAYWKAGRKYVEMGYAVKIVRLPGKKGDGLDKERAAKARQLTREMIRWGNGATDAIREGTWRWLIARYLGDATSPFHEIKANTARNYRRIIETWERAIGDALLSSCNHTEMVKWQRVMQDKGRSVHDIKSRFTMLRRLVSYGVMIEHPECLRLSGILSRMRIKSPPPRHVFPTREQVEAVIKQADAAGDHAVSLTTLFMWWFALRAVDVRGQWLEVRPGDDTGGIVKNGMRWADGMTWDMIDRDITRLTKVISKTASRNPDPITFDLTLVPEIRNRLLEVPTEKRVGPVILAHDGLPFRHMALAQRFRIHANAAGLPKHIKLMDVRAGAITEAKQRGASPYDLRDAAGHQLLSTTDRYARDRSAGGANVLRLRREP